MTLAARPVLAPMAATLVLVTLLLPGLHAAWDAGEPAGVAQGNTVNVATVAQLQSAISSLTSGTTIVIAPGVYRLTEELRIRNGVTNVGVRGATSNRDDVVLLGSGMNTQGINIVLKVENAQDVTIANLSIGEAFYHPIQLQGEQGADRIRIANVRLFDAGEQFIKSTVDVQNPNGVDDVTVEHSLIEYTRIGPDHGYTQGIDVHHGAHWLIHHNLFRNIHVPANAPDRLQPAILMWSGSRETVVHSNTFINCERGIIFGLGPQPPYEHSHSGGAIYNNFIYRTEPVNADSGISVWDSPGTRVYHNTVIQNGTYPTAIEYRFQTTTGVEIINNLTDGAIIVRDGAQGLVVNNFTQATPAFFVNAAAADLHLAETASLAIDHGMDLPSVTVDWDGEARPFGGAPDLGADERVTSTNRSPVALITAVPMFGPAPLTVAFDARRSTDPEGQALSFSWVFGDGQSGNGATIQHTYVDAGSYTATLRVTDAGGASSFDSVSVAVGGTITVAPTNLGAAPTDLRVTSPQSGSAVLTWSGNATGETEYVVERASGWRSTFREIARLPAGTQTFTETDLALGPHRYRVRAANRSTGQQSAYSNVVGLIVR
jgi:PKD repeat protein